jgi:uncharacterized protein (TIGR02996 family)
MNHHQAFLQDILEHPDDDAPRLIYADWLDDHGDADRAEFIRVQVELAHLTADFPRRRELAFRSWQLREEHGERWAEPIRPFVEEWHFHRGFIERVVVAADKLLSQGETLFRLAPIQRFRLTDARGDTRFLGSLPDWMKVTSLDLVGNEFQDDLLPALATCPALPSLKRFVLSCNPLRDGATELLCRHPCFDHLEGLFCGGNPMTDQGRQRLRVRFGERVVFDYQREDDHLYAFQDDGYGWHAGLVNDYLQVFMQENFPEIEVHLFDREGNLVSQEVRTLLREIPGEPRERRSRWDECVAGWRREVNLRPTTIRVKRFETREAGLVDLEWITEDFDRWDELSAEDQEDLGRRLHESWLRQGMFVYTDGNMPFLDKEGSILGH